MRRGGGIRVSGPRASFRSGGYRGHRTSHRHHHRYGTGRYYGRHRGYGYYGHGSGMFILFIILFITVLIPLTSVFGSTTIVIVFVVAIWFLIRRNESKKKDVRNYAGGSQVGSQVNVNSSGKTPLSQQYYQRPEAKFCNACGSGVLQNSTFCTECGTKV
ncbi:MAG: hypothetical protein HeimC2_37200 [Candidatus Heimdallarchaeota archaeon LC_2]|nr:MAG: hypothetical protein HeimC2_37200 [Candidatus Heimdallarchaeota archaeon LC_2]